MSKTFYITTPIYYVNDRPHIGHAFTTILADVQARFRRQQGQETFFLTGLDEHGIKVQQAAAKRGVPEQQHCDEMAPKFQELWKALNISNDDFVRTTQERHKKIVREFLVELHKRGAIYKKKYHGWYSQSAEQFVTEKEMVDGKFPSHLGNVVELEEENYFFRMSDHQKWLIDYIQSNPEWIQPASRRNEVLGMLQRPLEDLCISRPKARLAWGIPIPFDEEYVTYVWVDALVNYISIPGYGTDSFQKFWPANAHLIGKDILTTHAVYWPTMLHAMDIPMPEHIVAHGWWLMDKEKMSKSLGNVIDPHEYISKFGTDSFRYFLCRESHFASDSDFTDERFIQRFNADLANDLGNLVNRSISMIQRYRNGVVPELDALNDLDKNLLQTADAAFAVYETEMIKISYASALEGVWKLVSRANRYIEETAPFKLAKDPNSEKRLNTILCLLAETCAALSYLIEPFMPETASKISSQLQVANLKKDSLRSLKALAVGHQLGKPAPLFPRIEAAGTSPKA
jgi:methionyl-tRNA synthetase